jgi:Holliday junction resolvase RusA-like endonuclease
VGATFAASEDRLVGFEIRRYDDALEMVASTWDPPLPMAVHVEFVVLGPPISDQQSTATGKANLTAWRATIAGAAGPLWFSPVLTGHLKAIIINFYSGNKPSVDVDNMSKPILDVMQKVVYGDDRQIVQAEFTHLRIAAPFCIVGVSKVLVTALQAGLQFVYVRIEDPTDPFPLPK